VHENILSFLNLFDVIVLIVELFKDRIMKVIPTKLASGFSQVQFIRYDCNEQKKLIAKPNVTE